MSSTRCDRPRCSRRRVVRPVLVIRDGDGEELGREDLNIAFCTPCSGATELGELLTERQFRQVAVKYHIKSLPGADPVQSGVEFVSLDPSPRRTRRF